MERPRPATLAWGAILGSAAIYEAIAPEGELLSEAVDRALERPYGRYLAYGAIGVTALHLANLLPERIDPYHIVGEVVGTIRQGFEDIHDIFGEDDGTGTE